MEQTSAFRLRCRFVVSPKYELFYSLALLADPNARVHSTWRERARERLGASVCDEIDAVGVGHWLTLPALLPAEVAAPAFDDIANELEAISDARFEDALLRGLVHTPKVVEALVRGVAPAVALAKAPRKDHEWLARVGLYPFVPDAAPARALTRLLEDPARTRAGIVPTLRSYWTTFFEAEWTGARAEYERSADEKERLFGACSLEEFAQHALLRVGIDSHEGRLAAVRGSYSIAMRDVTACFFVPSAFNDGRFWSAVETPAGATYVYFPYFDPTVALTGSRAAAASDVVDPTVDPAMVFKALGDTTRYAIATLLAAAPRPSAELASALAVSRPTISHHVQILREAGLLRETHVRGKVELALRREVLEALSPATIRALFGAR